MHMHDNIPYMFNCRAKPVVDLLLKSSMQQLCLIRAFICFYSRAPWEAVLTSVSAAEQLVVVVVDRIGKAEPPHRVTRRRIHESAVAVKTNLKIFHVI